MPEAKTVYFQGLSSPLYSLKKKNLHRLQKALIPHLIHLIHQYHIIIYKDLVCTRLRLNYLWKLLP